MAPFEVQALLTLLTFHSKAVKNRADLTLSPSHLSLLETSAGTVCDVMLWPDWLVASLYSFPEKLPKEDCVIFHGLLCSGGKAVSYVTRHGMQLYLSVVFAQGQISGRDSFDFAKSFEVLS